MKDDKFSRCQCPQNANERNQMKTIPHASAIGILMYAQVCTHPDIAFIVDMLDKYLSDPGLSHRRAAKKVMRYLQGTKDLESHEVSLVYQESFVDLSMGQKCEKFEVWRLI